MKSRKGGYSEQQRLQISKLGNWRSLGLPTLHSIRADQAILVTEVEEAKRRIAKGEMVRNPFGEDLYIDRRSLRHLGKKGRSPSELKKRLQMLDAARVTVEHPHEIWADEGNGRRVYVRITDDPLGRRVVNAVDEDRDFVLSWHTNMVAYDYYRKGRLLWLRE